MSNELFTLEASADLGGPDWLKAFRDSAAKVAAGTPAPSPELEGWRYSRVEEVSTAGHQPVSGAGASGVPSAVSRYLSELGDLAGHVISVDGQIVEIFLSDEVPDGVTVGLAESAESMRVGESEPTDAFAAWNAALSTAPLVISVPRGADIAAPIAVFNHVTQPSSAVFPRLLVTSGENSSVAILEVFSSEDIRSLVVPVTEFSATRASRINHTVVQDLGPQMQQIAFTGAEVEQEATWRSAIAALGGDYARQRVDARLVGRGATGTVAAAYLGSADQMIDLRTFQEHVAQDTTSELYFKGALADRSNSVYTGMARIHSNARGSSADQANRVIKLSEDAWAESVPNLEIHNNDVRCAHASAVGPVDRDQRFYLESRGVPTRAAERLIVDGFFDDALSHFPVPEVVTLVSSRVDELLNREVAHLEGRT